MSGSALTAEVVAVALVAAAKHVGVEPLTVFERDGVGGNTKRRRPTNYRARVLAGGALRSCTGMTATALAPVLGLHAPDLAPSALAGRKLGAEDLLVVADALRARGLLSDDGARERFLKPWGPRRPKPDPQGGAQQPSPKPEARSPKPEARGCVPAGAGVKAGRGAAEPPPPPRRGPPPPAGEDVVVLKPVTDQVVKRAIDMLDARWDLQEVAGLFDVDPDALLNAIEARA